MSFALFLPTQSESGPVPLLWYLSGLTCTHENGMNKAGFQREAARLGLALLYPDTSPRGEHVPDDTAYDLGQGAGFYLNATQAPWADHYRMEDYIMEELPAVLRADFPQLNLDRQGIFGHSMGGHGALTLALRHPERFQSLSAFAPICNPCASDWGRKQFQAYLGEDENLWQDYDASALICQGAWTSDLLVDQGTQDEFLGLLRPDALEEAMKAQGQPGRFRYQDGYDHSYFFIATFAADHLRWHAERLCL
jgi:S-formylglutathione hydrolase